MRCSSKSPCQGAYQVAPYVEPSRLTGTAINLITHNPELTSITCLPGTMKHTKIATIHQTMKQIAINNSCNLSGYQPAVLVKPGGTGRFCIKSDLPQYGGLTDEASIWAFGRR